MPGSAADLTQYRVNGVVRPVNVASAPLAAPNAHTAHARDPAEDQERHREVAAAGCLCRLHSFSLSDTGAVAGGQAGLFLRQF